MQTRRNKKRRLSVQNLETRKLFAADAGFGDMTYGPEAPAEIGSVRPGKVGRPTFGPIDSGCPPCDIENQAEASTTTEPTKVKRPTFGPLNNGCPACDIENQAEASTTTEPTKVERPVFGPHIMTFDSVLSEQIGGSADPGSDDV